MAPTLSNRILEILSGIVSAPAALHEPVFAGREWEYVKDCLDTTMVSSVGAYVDRFEASLAEFTGVKRAICVVNGTAALQVCLQLAGVSRDDEVLVPSLTFVATANAVRHAGGIPHFIESARDTLGMCPASLAAHLESTAKMQGGSAYNKHSGRRIAACVPMHTFGHPVDLDPLLEACARWSIPVVEDAAESLGSYYQGRHTGSFGRLSALSFNGNKIVTTGGGGAILTNDESLGALAKHLTTTAKLPHAWEFRHDQVGYNYRLPNLNAAVGCAQMEELPGFLDRKRALAERYARAFAGVEGVRFVSEPSFGKSNYWLNTLVFDAKTAGEREATLRTANAKGWKVRPAWALMTSLPMYADCPRMEMPVAEELEACILNLPSGAAL